jgi:F420-dependent oxidoreductase-like protein
MLELQEGAMWADILGVATACERHGVESLFCSDHYAPVYAESPCGSLETWGVLSALAVSTQRLRLGTMVSPATFRHPSVLASLATTVDQVSGGRVELGIGAGWWARDHAMYGFDFPDLGTRLELLAEQAEIISGLWSGEEFSFDGRHYRLEGCLDLPTPVQRPHPPLIVAGIARGGTIHVAARFADEYNTPAASLEVVRQRRDRLVGACEEAGRDPETLPMSLALPLIVGDSGRDVTRRLERSFEVMGEVVGSVRTYDEAREHWLVGTPDEVLNRIGELERVGVSRLVLQLHDPTDLASIDLLGASVLSRLSRPGPG